MSQMVFQVALVVGHWKRQCAGIWESHRALYDQFIRGEMSDHPCKMQVVAFPSIQQHSSVAVVVIIHFHPATLFVL